MTSIQVINLGINDQLRLMAQGLESLNSKEMPCTLIVIRLLGMGYSLKKCGCLTTQRSNGHSESKCCLSLTAWKGILHKITNMLILLYFEINCSAIP